MKNVIDIGQIQKTKRLDEAYDLKNKSGLSVETIKRLDSIGNTHGLAVMMTGDSTHPQMQERQFLLETIIELMRTVAGLKDKLT